MPYSNIFLEILCCHFRNIYCNQDSPMSAFSTVLYMNVLSVLENWCSIVLIKAVLSKKVR